MTLKNLAITVLGATESTGLEFMVVGAIAAGTYGVPRATKDVDLLVAVTPEIGLTPVINALDSILLFDQQVVFNTLTWGRRHVGVSRNPPFKVEFFELFDDPFVKSEFSRRLRIFVPLLESETWLPTPEDVVVPYIEKWCALHSSPPRLQNAVVDIPPL